MEINETILKTYGIKNSEILDLKDFNIIIGKNGAGKTRLLKALRDEFLAENMAIIYAYFPDMHAHYGIGLSDEKYEIPLYEMIFEDERIEFNNVVQYIEQHGYDFLNELLRDIDKFACYKKSVRKERAENIQKELNIILEVLVNRKLIFGSEIIVKSSIYESEKRLDDDLKQMSPGELALFYLSILLIIIKYNKDDNQKLVVLLDEPELHLHPKVLIKFLEYLKNEKMIEMCCIATHSIFLIPLFDFYEIVHIEGGTVQPYNSKLYNNIFENIIGEDDRLSDFLISRDTWKYYQFIVECFYLPTVIEKVSTKDEQFLKFMSYVKKLGSIKKEITILDFGAGGGRLGKTINRMEESENYIKRKIKYFYYDKYQEKPEDLNCESFRTVDEIRKENKKFDCVVLMNVLHEIDINDWKETFYDIYDILEDDGYLLIFEVITLLHGEQPFGNSGYILLGEEQIRELFIKRDINLINLENSDKTNMYVIPKTVIKNVSDESILNALSSLKNSLYDSLREQYIIRKDIAHKEEKVLQQNVKHYGFLSQHYLNCLFAIETFKPKPNKEIKSITWIAGGSKRIHKLMYEIGENKDSNTTDILRKKMLLFKSIEDKDTVKHYLKLGNYYQRKSARYYFYNISD